MDSPFNSPFSEHVRTNYVPSSREKTHITQILVAPQQEVSVLEAEIAELQKKFDEIKARRDGLNTIVTEHRRLLAPFRRLPDNILKAIFIHCLPPDRNANMAVYEAPLLLGRVCRRWRDLAYDTPGLWATLHIAHIPLPTNALLEAEFSTREYPITSKIRHQLHAIAQWLDRSGTSPLSLSIHSSHDTVEFHLYLQLLLSFSHRWLDFEVRVVHESASQDLAILASVSPDAFPILEALQLTFPREMDESPPSEWKTHGGILRGKNLRSIGINHFPFDLANVEINWCGLTCLVLCDSYSAKRKSTPGEAHRILSNCVNLKHLTIDIYDPSPTGAKFATPYFYLPYLQSLSVTDNYYHLAILFDGIDAPCLNRVRYSTQFSYSNLRRSPLVALLSRSGQSIHSLQTQSQHLSLGDVVDCFRMTPFLSKLIYSESRRAVSEEQHAEQHTPITSNIGMQDIFKMLTPSSDGQCYWPRLQVIDSSICAPLDDQVVLTFIQERMRAADALKSRGDSILPLKKITLDFSDRIKKINIASHLEEYTRNGLQLDIRDYWDSFNFSEVMSKSASHGRFNSYAGINNRDDKTIIPF